MYPSQPAYADYGGRGIRVCDEWNNNFQAFYDWAMGQGWQPGLTIDRIDVNGHYSPENCRLIPKSLQGRNTRASLLITAFGETKTLKDWTEDERCRASYHCIFDRLVKLNWESEAAITIPTRSHRFGMPDIVNTNEDVRHGYAGTPLYSRWVRMLARCENPKTPEYKNYGARGIRVCSEWHDFVNFLTWTQESGYHPNLSLDRIDVNGNYEPNNCRWITRAEQSQNRRKARFPKYRIKRVV